MTTSALSARALAATVVIAAAAPAAASGDVFFKTPSGNIVCQKVDAERRVECAVLSTREGPDLTVYTLKKRGRAKTYTSNGNPATDVPVLAYGEKKRLLGGKVVCVSRVAGLRCRNRSDHGFFLSRDEQRRL